FGNTRLARRTGGAAVLSGARPCPRPVSFTSRAPSFPEGIQEDLANIACADVVHSMFRVNYRSISIVAGLLKGFYLVTPARRRGARWRGVKASGRGSKRNTTREGCTMKRNLAFGLLLIGSAFALIAMGI